MIRLNTVEPQVCSLFMGTHDVPRLSTKPADFGVPRFVIVRGSLEFLLAKPSWPRHRMDRPKVLRHLAVAQSEQAIAVIPDLQARNGSVDQILAVQKPSSSRLIRIRRSDWRGPRYRTRVSYSMRISICAAYSYAIRTILGSGYSIDWGRPVMTQWTGNLSLMIYARCTAGTIPESNRSADVSGSR